MAGCRRTETLGIRGHEIKMGTKMMHVGKLWNRGLEKETWKICIDNQVLITAHTVDTVPSTEDVDEQNSPSCL